MILTTPFGKKEGCAAMTKPVMTYNGGSAGFLQSIHPCRASLNSNKARIGNILNTNNRVLITYSPVFDTLLDSNLTKLKEEYK